MEIRLNNLQKVLLFIIIGLLAVIIVIIVIPSFTENSRIEFIFRLFVILLITIIAYLLADYFKLNWSKIREPFPKIIIGIFMLCVSSYIDPGKYLFPKGEPLVTPIEIDSTKNHNQSFDHNGDVNISTNKEQSPAFYAPGGNVQINNNFDSKDTATSKNDTAVHPNKRHIPQE